MQQTPQLYVVSRDDFLTFPYDDTVSYGTDRLEDDNMYFVPCKCTKCGTPSVQWGNLEDVLHEPRENGIEVYYSATNESECSQCGQKQQLDFDLTVYSFSWLWQANIRKGLDFSALDGFEDIVRLVKRGISKSDEVERLEARVDHLKFDRDILRKSIGENVPFTLIVEGRDDVAIWEQLMKSSNVPMKRVALVRYGTGGLGEAIKLARVFHSKVLKELPHLLIVDSDRDPKGVALRLKNEGLDEGEFYVLEKKEIESYLLEPEALSEVLGIGMTEIKRLLDGTKGDGKEKLNSIFQALGFPSPDEQMKALLARRLNSMPDELRVLMLRVQATLEALAMNGWDGSDEFDEEL